MAEPQIRYDILAQAEGGADVELLARELEKLDTAIDPQFNIRAKEVAESLRAIGRERAAVDQFLHLTAASEKAREALAQAQLAEQNFATIVARSGEPTRVQAGQLEKLRDTVRALGAEYAKNVGALNQQRAALDAARIPIEGLEQRQARLASQQEQLQKAAMRIGDTYRVMGSSATQSAESQVRAHKRVADGVRSISQQLDLLQKVAAAALGGQYLGGIPGDILKTADAYKDLAARIRLVTGEGAEFQRAFDGVFQVAQRTNSAVEETGTLFVRIAQAGKDIGVTTADALRLTETINQAIQLSGGSAESSRAAIVQLVQGLQSGVLRGEEFNSVMEQAPRLAQALAAGLGVTTGELRKMAQQGQLTSDTVIRALQGQGTAVAAEFEKLPLTVGRAIQNLSTAWTQYIGTVDAASGRSSEVAQAIQFVAQHLDTLGSALLSLGKIALAYKAIDLAATFYAKAAAAAAAAAATTAETTATVANTAATTANTTAKAANVAATEATGAAAVTAAGLFRTLGSAIAGLPVLIFVTIITNLREIGDWLTRNSALARQLGVGIVALVQTAINAFQSFREAAAASFNGEKLRQAFERQIERQRGINAIISDMFVQARRGADEVGQAATGAADATGKIGTAAQAAAGQVSSAGATAAAGVAQISHAASDAQQAILGIVTAAKAAPVQAAPAIGALAAQLREVATQSEDSARRTGTALRGALANLPEGELPKFRAALVQALQDAEREAQQLAEQIDKLPEGAATEKLREKLRAVNAGAAELRTGIDDVGKAAAKALGVDVEAAGTRASGSFKVALDSLAVLINDLPRLSAAGVDAGRVVSQAIEGMLAKAKNSADLDVLIGRVNVLEKANQLAADAAKKLREGIQLKREEFLPGIQSADEALRKLGVTSQTVLKQQAEDARQAFEAVRRGGASIEDVRAAFLKYAEAAIRANGGMASEAIKVQAAMLGVADKLSVAAGHAQQLKSEIEEAADRTARLNGHMREFVELQSRSNFLRQTSVQYEAQLREESERSLDVARQKFEQQQAEQKLRDQLTGEFSRDRRGNVLVAGEPQEVTEARRRNILVREFGVAAIGNSAAEEFARMQAILDTWERRLQDSAQFKGVDDSFTRAITEQRKAVTNAREAALLSLQQAGRERAPSPGPLPAPGPLPLPQAPPQAPAFRIDARVRFEAPGGAPSLNAYLENESDVQRLLELLRLSGARVTPGG